MPVILSAAQDLCPDRDPALRSGWHSWIGFVWRAQRLIWNVLPLGTPCWI